MSHTRDTMLVTLTAGQLVELVRDTVEAVLAEQGGAAVAPALLDREGLCRELGCSLATLDRMRREPGFPELRVGDSARFELPTVLEWLRNRKHSASGADRRRSPKGSKHAGNGSSANGLGHQHSAMEP